MEDLQEFLKDKIICITGGVGSVGTELINQLLNYDIAEVRSFDINESGIFHQQQLYSDNKRYIGLQGDISSEWDLTRIFKGADYVIHAAALKHVPSCEQNPFSAIDTNIVGMKSVIKMAVHHNVKKVLFTSSDKAVSPTNVMGGTKLLGERLFISANKLSTYSATETKFANTRFGNIACSNGSVIPIFMGQIKNKKSITVTDSRMTRFFMSLPEAATLVLRSLMLSEGGETFITKMPVINIYDLAWVIKEELDHSDTSEIIFTGTRLGEKLYEELSSEEETRRLLESDDFFCVIDNHVNMNSPHVKNLKKKGFDSSSVVYNSSRMKPLSRDEIRGYLIKLKILEKESSKNSTYQRGLL